MSDSQRLRVLFLCTGNSCRSQMAEGFARARHGDRIEVASAGTAPKGLDPDAVKVMAEVGIDISGQPSRTIAAAAPTTPDLVITVCGNADRDCPRFPGPVRVVHRGFDDPPALARDAADAEARLAPYRRVRDEIEAFVRELPDLLEDLSPR